MTMRRIQPAEVEGHRISSMADAMELAMERARDVEDPDPDPYGYASELEQEFSIDLLEDQWKSAPTDPRWAQRIRSRGRKQLVMDMFRKGFGVPAIAEKAKVSQTTVYKDLAFISQEWRKQYIADMETLASADLARMDYLMQKLSPAIDRGDVKAILAALEIINQRGAILGYRQGVQVDIEQYVREVAEANGYDGDKAVALAQRISVTMR